MNFLINTSGRLWTRNLGDQCTLPMRHFRFPSLTMAWDMYDQWPDVANISLILSGGLGGWSVVETILNRVVPRIGGVSAAWGIGTNNGLDPAEFAGQLGVFDMAGQRDWLEGYPDKVEWVPCSSCMSPEYDTKLDVSDEVVVFDHEDFPIRVEGFPRMSNHIAKGEPLNSLSIAKWHSRSLRFLGSAGIVLTSSYHGVYWATLLGKRVVCIPRGLPDDIRLFHFRHPPVISNLENWKKDLSKARPYPEALVECREANRLFFERFLERLS